MSDARLESEDLAQEGLGLALPNDDVVTLEWADSYSRSVGPPGARGNSETGITIFPELTAEPRDDSEVTNQIAAVVTKAASHTT